MKKEIAVAALCQRHGRGRGARDWFSPVGGLYVSLLLFPESGPTLIPFISALVVIKMLEHYGFTKLSIHWPNDVMLDRKKICGILCEEYKKAVICGIGLNVNILQFPRKLEDATSMKLATGKNYSLDRLLDEIIERFGQYYRKGSARRLVGRDIHRYLGGIGEAVEVVTRHRKYPGTIFGVDDDWALLLRDDQGAIHRFYYGDVKRLQW